MNTFLFPAIRLISRFNYPVKFLLIALTFALPIGFMLIQLLHSINEEIAATEREQQGLAYIIQLRSVVEKIQQHRGMSGALLGGDQSFADRIASNEEEIQSSWGSVRNVSTALGLEAELGAAQEKWQSLDSEWKQQTAATSFINHTELVMDLMQLMVSAADRSRLTFDPTPDGYYIKTLLVANLLPLEEAIAQARGMSTLMAARGMLQLEDRTSLAIQTGTIRSLLTETELNIERSFSANRHIQENLQQYRLAIQTDIRSFDDLIDNGLIKAEQPKLSPADGFSAGSRAIAATLKFYDAAAKNFTVMLDERASAGKRKRTLLLGITVCLLALGGYLFAGTYASIHGAITDLREAATRFASGDLTGRVKLTVRDELVHVADSFNGMADHIGHLIDNIAQAVERITHSATELSVVSEQVAKGSQEQSNAASAMAASVQQVTVSIAMVADNSRRADEVAEKARTLSADGLEVVQSAVSEMRNIALTVRDSATKVDSLGESSTQIAEILGVIKSIADQTNLLALNAAIEAARAGETGRGFAVVADEVRKLAERTAQATTQIGDMIEKIRAETASAVVGMEQGCIQTETGVDLANSAGKAMELINIGAAEVTQAVSEIAAATQEQSAASNEIARNVEWIAQMAEENANAVRQSAQAARKMEAEAERLNSAVHQFRM
jgi:methyl-accepting chemotaxis protein